MRFQWKIHDILPVCKMACLSLCYFFRYPLRRRRPILGGSVESRTPLEEFLNVLKLYCFISVYLRIFGIKILKKVDIKGNRFQGTEPP